MNSNSNRNRNRNKDGDVKMLVSPAQARHIKMLLYLADGHESLQLSDMRTYRAWKEFFFQSICEMEELGLLKSIRTYPLGSSSMFHFNAPIGIKEKEEEQKEKSSCSTSSSTRRARADNDNPFKCKGKSRESREKGDMNMNKVDMNKNNAWNVWGQEQAIKICPVVNWSNWSTQQECDQFNPDHLDKAWKSFLLDMLYELEAEGLIKISGGQAPRPKT